MAFLCSTKRILRFQKKKNLQGERGVVGESGGGAKGRTESEFSESCYRLPLKTAQEIAMRGILDVRNSTFGSLQA